MLCSTPPICRPNVKDAVIYQICAECVPSPPAVIPPEWDCEWMRGCDDVNGDGSSIVSYLIRICVDENTGLVLDGGPVTLTMSGAPYAPINPVACPASRDLETERLCFRSVATPDVRYFRTDMIDPETSTVVAVIWQDEAGAVIAAPSGIQPCDENADRVYVPRTSGMLAAAFSIPAPVAPAQLRSFSLLVHTGNVVMTNGPDAGSVFIPGSYSWSAPVTAPGAERGYLSFLPSFAPSPAASFMVNWTEG